MPDPINPHEPVTVDGFDLHPSPEVVALRRIARRDHAGGHREARQLARDAIRNWQQATVATLAWADDEVTELTPGARVRITGPDATYRVMGLDTGPGRAELRLTEVEGEVVHLPTAVRGLPHGDDDEGDGGPEPLPAHAERVREFLGVSREQVVDVTHDPCEAQADALRAEVARLTALLDDAAAEADRADTAQANAQAVARALDAAEGDAQQHRVERDEARAEVVRLGRRVEQLTADLDDAHATLVDLAPLREQQLAADHDGRTLATSVTVEGVRHLDTLPIELDVRGPGLVTFDGRELRIAYHPATTAPATTDQTGRPLPPGRLDDDPRRPHRGDPWPLDAVTITYPELRQLIALHLDQGDHDPRLPSVLARAMRDGETPLRISEVLDR